MVLLGGVRLSWVSPAGCGECCLVSKVGRFGFWVVSIFVCVFPVVKAFCGKVAVFLLFVSLPACWAFELSGYHGVWCCIASFT